MSLRDALAVILREHRYRRAGSTYVDGEWVKGSCQCGWEGARAAHAAHIADLQIAYLRDHLAEHGDELGMRREDRWMPVESNGHRWAPRSKEEALANLSSYGEHGPLHLDGTNPVVRVEHESRFVTDWSRADD